MCAGFSVAPEHRGMWPSRSLKALTRSDSHELSYFNQTQSASRKLAFLASVYLLIARSHRKKFLFFLSYISSCGI